MNTHRDTDTKTETHRENLTCSSVAGRELILCLGNYESWLSLPLQHWTAAHPTSLHGLWMQLRPLHTEPTLQPNNHIYFSIKYFQEIAHNDFLIRQVFLLAPYKGF